MIGNLCSDQSPQIHLVTKLIGLGARIADETFGIEIFCSLNSGRLSPSLPLVHDRKKNLVHTFITR